MIHELTDYLLYQVMWWIVLPAMQGIKSSFELIKSEKMIGKTHGTICVDLSVCMGYSQKQTKEAD